MLIPREQLTFILASLDLKKTEDRAKINGIVIDEVIDRRFAKTTWEVKGFAPLTTIDFQILRPCLRCCYGIDGWKIREVNEWISE